MPIECTVLHALCSWVIPSTRWPRDVTTVHMMTSIADTVRLLLRIALQQPDRRHGRPPFVTLVTPIIVIHVTG